LNRNDAVADAAKLEALIPRAMTVLFRGAEEDPLRHLPLGQIRLLRALSTGTRSASELIRELGLSASSLTQMASRLVANGLVSKELDVHD
jgi:DNA-binding MarR family transcriptional regulator